MRHCGAIVRSTVSYALLALCVCPLVIPIAVCMIMPVRWRYTSRFFYTLVYTFYWLALKCSFLPLAVRGANNMPVEPAIVVANHQSSLDIALVGSAIGSKSHLWLAWSELFKRPFLGYILPYVALAVNVSTPTKAARSLAAALAWMRTFATHVVMFPEGERHVDGAVHDFYAGFAILARKTGRAVVPVYLQGACVAYPPGSYIVRWQPLHVTVGKPMSMEAGELDEHFRDRVRSWFLEQSEG